MNIVIASVVVLVTACGNNEATPTAGSAAKGAGTFLTVGAYCDGFCAKLCATCGQNVSCDQPCHNRCYFGRTADKLLDGSDPKTGLALTKSNLDACTAAITNDTCIQIASGQVPPVCFTIQH